MESIIKKAFEVALEAHKKQKRKATDIPYIVHPMEVTIILMKNGANEELIAAGLLHDVVEDTDVTIEEIEKKFGKKIAFLVQSVTEPTKLNKKLKKEDEKKTWKERKKHTIDSIKSVSKEVKMLSCADKLANISSMLEDYAIIFF
ncbi:HD domain-containing protein [Candidatus Micrarchaeota archaeon]|nr:HD domain-containing protein [Candidatus Micrarchaeota archaeon]